MSQQLLRLADDGTIQAYKQVPRSSTINLTTMPMGEYREVIVTNDDLPGKFTVQRFHRKILKWFGLQMSTVIRKVTDSNSVSDKPGDLSQNPEEFWKVVDGDEEPSFTVFTNQVPRRPAKEKPTPNHRVERSYSETLRLMQYVCDELIPENMYAKDDGQQAQGDARTQQAVQDNLALLQTGAGPQAHHSLQRKRMTLQRMQQAMQFGDRKAHDVEEAKDVIRIALGAESSLIVGHPAMRHVFTMSKSETPKGEKHLLHQLTGLAWILERHSVLGCGIIADDMGLGKSHEIISAIFGIISKRYCEGVLPENMKPTLLVVPGSLAKSWQETLERQVDTLPHPCGGTHPPLQFRVYRVRDRLPNHALSRKDLQLDKTDTAFKDKSVPNGHKIFIASNTYFQTMKPDQYPNLPEFDRVIVDEAHMMRNLRTTLFGEVMQRILRPETERWAFTGTPAYHSLDDWIGLLSFTCRPHWKVDRDLNPYACSPSGFPAEDQPWDPLYMDQLRDGESVSDYVESNAIPDYIAESYIKPEQYQNECDGKDIEKPENHGFCTDWPGQMTRNHRAPSLPSSSRTPMPERGTSKSRGGEIMTQPFKMNPYNFQHELNKNFRNALTPEAFWYWIHPHIHGHNPNTLYWRMRPILNELVLTRNSETMMICADGEKSIRELSNSPLADMSICRLDLCYNKEEIRLYMRRRQELAENPNVRAAFREELKRLAGKSTATHDDSTEGEVEDYEAGLKTSKGRNSYYKAMALASSLCLTGLRGMSTSDVHEIGWLPDMVRIMYAGGFGGNPDWAGVKELGTPEEVLKHALWGSPSMKAAIPEIMDVFEKDPEKDGRRRKVLCLATVPRTAALFHRILGYMGVYSTLLTSEMSPDERCTAIMGFNKPSPDKHQGREVLIATYGLNIAGHNLHQECCNVIALEPGTSLAEETQGAYRVHRWGQDELQRFTRMHVVRSYMAKAEARIQANQTWILSSATFTEGDDAITQTHSMFGGQDPAFSGVMDGSKTVMQRVEEWGMDGIGDSDEEGDPDGMGDSDEEGGPGGMGDSDEDD